MLKKNSNRYEVRFKKWHYDTKCASVVTEQNQESACYKCELSDAVQYEIS